jgi:hypothetical protein
MYGMPLKNEKTKKTKVGEIVARRGAYAEKSSGFVS